MNYIDIQFHINEYFKEFLPILVNVFKDFYGEEYHDIIEDRFSNFTFIGYLSPAHICQVVDNLCQEISQNLARQFLEDNHLEVDDQKLSFFGFDNLKRNHIYSITQISDFLRYKN